MYEETKKILLQMKENLLNDISCNIKSESNDLKSEIGDTFDLAGNERDREISLLLCDRDREKLMAIEGALTRMADGTYGICEECEDKIAEGRLKVMPFATLCITCKSEMEAHQKDKMMSFEPDIYHKLAQATTEEDE